MSPDSLERRLETKAAPSQREKERGVRGLRKVRELGKVKEGKPQSEKLLNLGCTTTGYTTRVVHHRLHHKGGRLHAREHARKCGKWGMPNTES